MRVSSAPAVRRLLLGGASAVLASACLAGAAQAAETLNATFDGYITSGSLGFLFNGPPPVDTTTNIVGHAVHLNVFAVPGTTRDAPQGRFTATVEGITPGIASIVNGEGFRGGNTTIFDLSPTAFHLNINAFSSSNDTGTLDLLADVVGGHLINWRGTFSGTSQPNILNGLGTYFYRDVSFAVTAVTGTLPVPEPGTWAMMLGGFALLGAATRRQARVARLAG